MAERLPEGVIHQFVPVDLPSAVARFLDHWHPEIGFVIEREYAGADRRGPGCYSVSWSSVHEGGALTGLHRC